MRNSKKNRALEWQTKPFVKEKQGMESGQLAALLESGFIWPFLQRSGTAHGRAEMLRESSQDAKNVAGRNRLGGSYL